MLVIVCLLFIDDEEALNSIMKDLAALGRCYTQHNSHKPKNRTLFYKQVWHCSTNRDENVGFVGFRATAYVSYGRFLLCCQSFVTN